MLTVRFGVIHLNMPIMRHENHVCKPVFYIFLYLIFRQRVNMIWKQSSQMASSKVTLIPSAAYDRYNNLKLENIWP